MAGKAHAIWILLEFNHGEFRVMEADRHSWVTGKKDNENRNTKSRKAGVISMF